MDKSTQRLILFLLAAVSLALFAAQHLFTGDLVEKFNQNKYAQFANWIFGALGLLLGIWGLLTQKPKDPLLIQAQEAQRKRAELEILLGKVESFWVEGVFNNSLHEAALLQLGKESQPGQVLHPLSFTVELPHQENSLLPAKTTITEVFNKQAARHLLILGEPGAGKTTSLLELTRDLIKEARKQPSKPIPVVFTLSSWSARPLPLAEWMAFELFALYQIPQTIGTRWLADYKILPLLDGLDEVQADQREACALAINQYAQEAGLTGLVVVSRRQEYETLAAKLKLRLNAAVNLLPLRPQQIEQYLAAGGKAWAGLRGLLKEDAELQELAQSPLCLSLMALAYHGVPLAEARASADGGDKRGELFERYIAKMFERRKGEKPLYPKAQVLAGLSWLAKNMKQRGQTVLLLEYIQPDWLPSRLGYRLLYGLLGFGVSYLVGMVIGANPMTRLALPLFGGMLFYLFSDTIKPIENIRWSWDKLKRFGWFGCFLMLIFVSLIIGLMMVIANLAQGNAWLNHLPFFTTACLIISLAGIAYQGFDNQFPVSRTQVNQGIVASGRNILRYGLPFGIVTGLLLWLAVLKIGYEAMSWASFGYWLSAGLAFGTLSFGIEAIIKHYLLRLTLCLERLTPLNYVRFLDYVARLILLRNVGGGYQFVHRLLLEHFARRDLP